MHTCVRWSTCSSAAVLPVLDVDWYTWTVSLSVDFHLRSPGHRPARRPWKKHLSYFYLCRVVLNAPAPRVGGIKRWCASDICLSRTWYTGPKSRTERPRKTKIGKEVAHITRDSDTTFKVKGKKSTCRGRGRPRKTKIGKEVAHITRDSDTTFKVKGKKSTCRGWGHIVAASRTACWQCRQHRSTQTQPRIFRQSHGRLVILFNGAFSTNGLIVPCPPRKLILSTLHRWPNQDSNPGPSAVQVGRLSYMGRTAYPDFLTECVGSYLFLFRLFQ